MAAKKSAKKVAKKAAKAPAKPAAKKSAKAPARAAAKKTAKKAAKRAAPRSVEAASPVVHWEIRAKDPAKIQSFYANVFGWAIDANNPMNYGMVSSGGKQAINGGIGGTPDGKPAVVVYAQVKDINAILARAESHGATTLMPRTDVGPVIMAVFADVEGNQFGIIEG